MRYQPLRAHRTPQRTLDRYRSPFPVPSSQDLVGRKRASDAKAIHVLSSGIKAAATWGRVEVMQVGSGY